MGKSNLSRGHVLSWLHTVDTDDLPSYFGGAESKGGVIGEDGKMNDRDWSMLPFSEVLESRMTLARVEWSCTRPESTTSVVTG